MNFSLNLDFFISLYQNLYNWATHELFTRVGIYQIGVLLLVFFLSLVLSKLIKKSVHAILHIKAESSQFYSYLKLFILPVLLFIFSAISKLVFSNLNWNYVIINIFSSIIAAWILIKIISLIFKKALWLRPLIFIIWILAILNILGLLNKFLLFLEQIQINLGNVNINLLLVIKGFFATIFVFWLALKISGFTQKNINKNDKITPTMRVLLGKTAKIVLLLIAGLFILNVIGLKLTTFTVLGGAIGVGIGFGLQKIVSNFISGFILLFDKSVKPGDIIQIENTFGIIQKMNARYITVLTLGGKEHLIPNEDFIINKVVNWSHTDRFIMLEVAVGVSYNTNIPEALEIIKLAAKSVKRCLKAKEPVALITDFGTSSIDLKVKLWITDPEKGIENISSDIRLEIWKRFKEKKIEIPFPQQDIHIKDTRKQEKLD